MYETFVNATKISYVFCFYFPQTTTSLFNFSSARDTYFRIIRCLHPKSQPFFKYIEELSTFSACSLNINKYLVYKVSNA